MTKPKYYLKPYHQALKAYQAIDGLTHILGISKDGWETIRKENQRPIDWQCRQCRVLGSTGDFHWNIPTVCLTKRIYIEEAQFEKEDTGK